MRHLLNDFRLAFVLSSIAPSIASAQAHFVREVEPNDAATTATSTTLGDTVSGALTKGDVDYWVLDIAAPTRVELAVLSRSSCQDFVLLDHDGVGLAASACLESNDTLYYAVRAPGRYYVRITPYDDSPGEQPPRPYTMRFAAYVAPPLGPGNPMAVFATGLNRPEGIVAAPTGDLYVADETGTGVRIVRVSPGGQSSVFATDVQVAFGAMAIDGFGDLLVSAYADPQGSGGVVWRYSPEGRRTQFVAQPQAPNPAFTGIAIGPDGDVWFADPGFETPSRIWRFDPLGNLKDTIDVAAAGRAWTVAMSPSGQLHFMTQYGDVYRLVGRAPQLVISAPQRLMGWSQRLAFDRDGFLYVIAQDGGKIVLYDPQYHAVTNPFTQVLDSLRWSHARLGAGPVFARDAHGDLNRLVIGRYCCEQDPGPEDIARGDVLEIDPAAIRAPGADVTPHLERVSVAEITAALLNHGQLSAALTEFLDLHGNHNGKLDVGDLRAYLRAQHRVGQ